MNIQTKLDLGQPVWAIWQARKTRSNVCYVCNGSGRIAVANFPAGTYCPNRECVNGKVDITWYDEWEIRYVSRIGKITAELSVKSSPSEDRITYMIEATGVGSGTVWDEANLFASHEEAQGECFRRNALPSSLSPSPTPTTDE